jgi:hypothetical protein
MLGRLAIYWTLPLQSLCQTRLKLAAIEIWMKKDLFD